MNQKLVLLAVMATAVLTARLLYGTAWGNYESKTASQKLAWLMSKVAADKGKSSTQPGALSLAALVAPELLGGSSFTPTGHLYSDEFPKSQKVKGIHAVGHAGSGKFVWNDYAKSTYTGGFKAADYVFFRFSTATAPSGNPLENGPGLSIKILRDKVVSGSTPVMWQLKGQKSSNFFANCLSNHIDSPPSGEITVPQKILLSKFKRYDRNPGLVGLSDIASYNQDGSKVASPKAPMALILVATDAVKKQCEGKPMKGDLYTYLEDLAPNTALYDIYSVDRPYTPTELKKLSSKMSVLKKMGQLVITSKLVPSKFADEDVQFKHVFWKDDVKALGKENEWKVSEGDEYDFNGGCKKFMDKIVP